MAEYIKREDALTITTRTCGDYAAAWSEIRKLPAADVAEVVHGEWIPCDNGGYYCSHCDTRIAFRLGQWFCSNCGAKMDGGAK
jgi:ribosomal protein L37AE/L43A|uniref:Zinc-ribbon protein n=1 Tax=Siphoviridae sp. ct37J14 TaxID=2826280 RepID=A0A8S5M0R6_9CAUD|nr:MAG TPA: zinc-ribbon protein [Siphoviridae sp. ct37J14]